MKGLESVVVGVVMEEEFDSSGFNLAIVSDILEVSVVAVVALAAAVLLDADPAVAVPASPSDLFGSYSSTSRNCSGGLEYLFRSYTRLLI